MNEIKQIKEIQVKDFFKIKFVAKIVNSKYNLYLRSRIILSSDLLNTFICAGNIKK